jgi:hypothetical protein
MGLSVTSRTQGDQVQLGIISTVAAKLSMMHFQVRRGPAALASPTVSSQHVLAYSSVPDGIEPQSYLFWPDAAHAASFLAPAEMLPFARVVGIGKISWQKIAMSPGPHRPNLPLPGNRHRSSPGNTRANGHCPASAPLFRSPYR